MKHIHTFESFLGESSPADQSQKYIVWTQDPGKDKVQVGNEEYDERKALTAYKNISYRYRDNETVVGVMSVEDWNKEQVKTIENKK